MISRSDDLRRIKAALEPELILAATNALVAQGDSLALLRKLPDRPISLILTDPPYHATKKQNIHGDTAFAEDKHYLEWMAEYAIEWHRVLRPNGSLFCFCDSSMSSRLDVMFSKSFNVLSHIVWTKPNDPGFDGWKGKMKKESLRQWYPHSERILFAEPAVDANLERGRFVKFALFSGSLSGGAGGAHTALSGHGILRRPGCCPQRFVRASWQPVLGFTFGCGVRLRPRKKLVQIEIEIGCDSSSGITDLLDDGVFHIWGMMRSSGVQITGM